MAMSFEVAKNNFRIKKPYMDHIPTRLHGGKWIEIYKLSSCMRLSRLIRETHTQICLSSDFYSVLDHYSMDLSDIRRSIRDHNGVKWVADGL